MELTGRITADAAIRKTTDGREVVGFTLAMNDQYKSKSGDTRRISNFFHCSYWVAPKLAQHLKRGAIVTVYGRIGLYAYLDSEGKPQASFNFHVHDIKFVAGAAQGEAASTGGNRQPKASNTGSTSQAVDDLPF
jgi:single-strand DNA-binding protein